MGSDAMLRGMLGMRVVESAAVPADMIVVSNGGMLQKFIWTANALADQEREIDSLRAEVSRLRGEVAAAERRAEEAREVVKAAQKLVDLHRRDLNPSLHPFDDCLVCALAAALLGRKT